MSITVDFKMDNSFVNYKKIATALIMVFYVKYILSENTEKMREKIILHLHVNNLLKS